MSCDIALGRKRVACKEIAGLSAVYFVKTEDLGTAVTYDANGKVTDFGAMTVYKYELLTGTNIDDDSQASSDTGTQFNTVSGTITLVGAIDTDPLEFNKLQSGLYSIIGEMRSGKAKLYCPDSPIDITSLKVLNGAAEGDLIGATMDLAGKSTLLSPYITGAIKGNPFAGITTPANVTVIS